MTKVLVDKQAMLEEQNQKQLKNKGIYDFEHRQNSRQKSKRNDNDDEL